MSSGVVDSAQFYFDNVFVIAPSSCQLCVLAELSNLILLVHIGKALVKVLQDYDWECRRF